MSAMATVDPENEGSTVPVEKERTSSFQRARFTIFGKRPSKPTGLKAQGREEEVKDTVESVLGWHNGFSEQIVDVLDRPERMSLQIWAVMFACLGFVSSSFATDFVFKNENELNEEANWCKLVSSLSTVCLVIAVVRMHLYDCEVEKERGYIAPSSTIFSLGRHTNIYIELGICLAHAPYNMHFVVREPITYSPQHVGGGTDYAPVFAYHSLDSLANVFMSARLYLLFPLIHHFLGLTGPGPRVVARFTNIIFDMSFSMKAILERHGLLSLLLAIFVFAAHGAWLMKVRRRQRLQWRLAAAFSGSSSGGDGDDVKSVCSVEHTS